jgi:cytochrome c peroxidase
MPQRNVLIKRVWILLIVAGALAFWDPGYAQQEQRGGTSYMKVDSAESFPSLMARMTAAKPGIAAAHNAVLAERYDLSNRPAQGVTMDRGKPVQEGVRVKLAAGMTWERLAGMSPDEIRDRDLYPKGFYPLPHPNHPEGGFVFPQFEIDAIKQQDGRDLTRFDLDFDLPDHFLAEFPPAMYLTPRPDLGDVSQGKLVSLTNYFDLFNGILTPRQLEGLRLLLTPFPQQQFNATEDRRFDCHSNGHQNGTTHLAPDTRPQQYRHRIKTVSLRGVNNQRLFGSQRALKTIEDFTEFEQRTAYFDGDIVIAVKKGANPLPRGTSVDFMADFQEMLDFPPAPKLDIFGKLIPGRATPAEMRGQEIFFGKAQCASCHPPPFYTDNLMHSLETERFFKPVMINNMMAIGDGKIKTFPLRGIKDNPPYLHDERLLTLEDTVEFFNLVLGTKLAPQEKRDLVAFLRAL